MPRHRREPPRALGGGARASLWWLLGLLAAAVIAAVLIGLRGLLTRCCAALSLPSRAAGTGSTSTIPCQQSANSS